MKHAALVWFLVFCTSCKSERWSPEPLDRNFEGTIAGVAFKIQLPKSWKFDPMGAQREADPAEIRMEWRAPNRPGGPSVMLTSPGPSPDLQSFERRVMTDVSTDIIAKKEQSTDRLLIVSHTSSFDMMRVDLQRTKIGEAIHCRAAFRTEGGVPSPKVAMDWLQSICESLMVF